MKNRRLVIGIAGIVAAVMLVSCSSVSVPKMSEPVTSFEVSQLATGNTAMEGQRLDDFQITVPLKRYFGVPSGPAWIGNEGTDLLVRAAIDTEIIRQGGTQAINVSVGHEAKMTDFILNGFTGFIYAPSNVRISGTVVR